MALRRDLENGEALITTDIDAALLRNLRRRHGVPLGTLDALLAQPCIRYDLTLLLTADHDFARAAIHGPLKIWGAVPYITPRPTQGPWGPGPPIRPHPYAMPPYQARSTATGC
ncbi:PIN domain-containing protein [Acidiferrobacter thiooxydans]|uniref:PIN domain-containing protein n=1 Tax=Acidiferrobacter thiooxydans TaxID=163359 RepID=A0A368HI44_9GAMM|nr:PIN domain-containing protein [Acidiferrobacter thiooxydans]UEO01386.1 PIN domain-containing protein [Acidiferrobacter thiooxydans]